MALLNLSKYLIFLIKKNTFKVQIYLPHTTFRIFARDEHIALIAGLGHTGSAPFDAYNGWYKDKRGLAGSVSYNKSQPLWKSKIHFKYPIEFRNAIFTLLAPNEALLALLGPRAEVQRCCGA